MIQNIQFPTELKPIQVAGGRRIPDRQAVVRQDTGEVLGIVGPNYQMIRHIDVVDQFQRIDKLELKEVHSCRRGAIMFAKFDFKGNNNNNVRRWHNSCKLRVYLGADHFNMNFMNWFP